MVRQILPILDVLILFIIICEGSSLIPDESGIAWTRQGRVPQPPTTDRRDLIVSPERLLRRTCRHPAWGAGIPIYRGTAPCRRQAPPQHSNSSDHESPVVTAK